MKSTRLLGLAVIAALLAAAFIGAGTASAVATKLCKANEETCSKENTLPGWFTGIAANFSEKPTEASIAMPPFLPTVTCKLSKFNGSEFTSAGGPLVGSLSYWYNEECAPKGCTMGTVVESPSSLAAEIEATSGGNGTIRVEKPVLKVACTGSSNFSCTYTKTVMEFPVIGGSHAKVSTSSTVTKVSGAVCPNQATFKANYEIWEPPSLFVTH